MDLPLYFISDIHLMPLNSDQETVAQQKLFQFLHHVADGGGSLFIVGDIFDFYFEYPHVIPKMYFQFYFELNLLKHKGIEVHFVLGNHDYWVQDFITDTLTTKTYFNDTTLHINGKKFYITHGDGLLSWDWGYRILKTVIRHPLSIWCYRWLHPTIGYRLANWVSRSSQHYEHSDEYNRRVLAELETVAENHTNHGYDYVITGHYHQAVDKQVNGGKLLILGDWIHYFTYGYFDGNDLTLKTWESHA